MADQRTQAPPDISEWDWVGTSEAMIDRIRPKPLYERAVVAVAIILVVGLNIAALQFRPPQPLRYEFLDMGSYVVIADRGNGTVAACRATTQAVVCTEEDSSQLASLRKLRAEWDALE